MADGKIVFDTAIDNKGLEKDLAKQKKIIEQSTKKIEGLNFKKTGLEKSLENSEKKIKDLRMAYDALEQKMKERSSLGYDTSGISSELSSIDKEAEAAYQASEKIREQIEEISRTTEAEDERLTEARDRAQQLSEALANARKESQKGASAIDKFKKKIISIAKSVFIFSIIAKAFRSLKNYISDVAKKNTEFNNSLAQMRGAWRTAFQPVVEFVMPYLIKLINFLTKVGYAIAALFAKFTGRSLADLKASTKAANENAKAVNNQVKAYKQLASFDEMDVLQSDTSSADTSAAAETPSATYDFDTSEIESKLGEIEAIAGAASLAIGLLLTLFGHWAIGIPLMAAGAAMLIDAANTEGSALNKFIQEHLEEVTSGLIIAGMAAIAIGLALTFFGMIPLGIALIGIGVASLYEAAQLSGGINELIQQNLKTITSALVIIGLVAVALGLILLLCGDLPHGLALIVLGAGSLIGAAALNWDAIKEFFTGIWNAIKAVAEAVWTAVAGFFELVWKGISVTASTVWNGIKTFFVNLWNGMKNTAIAVWDAIKAFIVRVWEAMKNSATNIWNAIKTFMTNVWNGLKNTATSVWNAIQTFFANVWNGIKSTATTVWNAIKTFIVNVWNGLKNTATSVWNSITSFFSNTWSTIKSRTTSIWESIKSFFVNLWNSMKNTVSTVWTGIKTGIVNTVNSIKSSITTAFTTVKTFISTTFNNIKTTILNVWTTISTGIKSTINTILSVVEGMVNGVIDGINFMIRALNKLSFTVPDWVPKLGGKSFGFNLREVQRIYIPRLAEGAVIPANREFLAVLGDQKQGTNIETPLDTMIDAFKTALQDYNGGDVTIPIYLDGRQIARHVININKQRQFAMNGGV